MPKNLKNWKWKREEIFSSFLEIIFFFFFFLIFIILCRINLLGY